jgi:hypothetical protein
VGASNTKTAYLLVPALPSADSAAAVNSFSSKANNCSRQREGGPSARLVSSSIGATRGLAIHGLLSGPCHPPSVIPPSWAIACLLDHAYLTT